MASRQTATRLLTGRRAPTIATDGPAFARPGPCGALLLGLGTAALLMAAVGVAVGPVTISLADVGRVLADHLGELLPDLLGGRPGAGPRVPAVVDQIVWTVRLPRVVLAALAGAALSVAGAVIQAVVRNPLGDPYLIGIVPGAGLGAVAVIVLGTASTAGLSLSAAAFVGALGAFALTFALARRGGEWHPTRLVLAGVAVGYLLSALTFFLQTRASPTELARVLFWSLGSVSGADWSDLPLLTVVTLGGTAWLVLRGRHLNALVGGTDLTRSLGIDVARFQLELMALTALVCGAVVAVVGGIGFVGLMVPHLARLLVGADHRRVLLVCVPLGAVVMLAADLAARLALAPAELPIGIVTAAGGAPFFLWLLSRRGPGAA